MLTLTVSDLRLWLACRRRWELGSSARRGLSRIGDWGSGWGKRTLGTLVHSGLEAMALGCAPGESVWARARTEIEDGAPAAAVEELAQRSTLICWRYLEAWGGDSGWPGYEIVGAEVPWRCPTPGWPEAGSYLLAGTIDLIVRDSAGVLWIVDHKTYDVRPGESRLERLQYDLQFRCYDWALSRMVGEDAVGGWCWDGIRQAVPSAPRQLKSGALSRDLRSADITKDSYLAEVIRLGLDPADYADVFAKLHDRPDTFFDRRWYRASADLRASTGRLLEAAGKDIAATHGRAIDMPAPDSTCSWCGVRGLCDAMEHGDDWETLAHRHYQRREYGTRLALAENNVTTIRSVEDLSHALSR